MALWVPVLATSMRTEVSSQNLSKQAGLPKTQVCGGRVPGVQMDCWDLLVPDSVRDCLKGIRLRVIAQDI